MKSANEEMKITSIEEATVLIDAVNLYLEQNPQIKVKTENGVVKAYKNGKEILE